MATIKIERLSYLETERTLLWRRAFPHQIQLVFSRYESIDSNLGGLVPWLHPNGQSKRRNSRTDICLDSGDNYYFFYSSAWREPAHDMVRNNNSLEAIVDGTSWRHHRAIWVWQLIQALLDDQTNQPVSIEFEIAARCVPVAKILRNECPKYEKDTPCWYIGDNNVTHLSRIIVCNSLIWSFCSSTLRLLPNLYSLGFVPLLLTVPISFYLFRITGKTES